MMSTRLVLGWTVAGKTASRLRTIVPLSMIALSERGFTSLLEEWVGLVGVGWGVYGGWEGERRSVRGEGTGERGEEGSVRMLFVCTGAAPKRKDLWQVNCGRGRVSQNSPCC